MTNIKRRILCSALAFGSLFVTSTFDSFIDTFTTTPVLIINVLVVILFLVTKYQEDQFCNSPKDIDDIVKDGYLYSSLLAGITVLSGLVRMLSNLSAYTLIGPSLAMVILGMVYGLVLIIFIFYPLSSKPLPCFVVYIPIGGILIILLSFFVLLVSFF